MQLVLTCILLAGIFQYASAVVQTSDVPLDLAKCYGRLRTKTSLTRTPAASIQTHCENMYMWNHAKDLNSNRGANTQTVGYIRGLFQNTRQAIAQHRIKKRQAGPPPRLRLRKEIRMMSDQEIQTYFAAVNSAKRNTSIAPNKYDALAEFHTGMTSLSAHGGCNFHGWHRMYLLMFENALREEGPAFADVTVPYWDSTLDHGMEDPRQSILFTDRFMGSCQGEAKGGIMGTGWDSSTGMITRNCGTDGPLVTEEMIHNVTRHSNMRAICGENSEIDDDWEFHHNGVHRWIDGQMAILSSAVYDPVFWIHHCFVDMVWELFRDNQKRAGVNPETDYPANPTTMGAAELHLPTADMGFADLKVIDGLSEMFTREWYRYAPRPTCFQNQQDCGSKYLKCMPRKGVPGQFHCVSKTLKEVLDYEAELNRPKPEPCITPTVNPAVVKPPPKEIMPVQNTYCMNGKSDIQQWVYIPVKLILRRPPDYKSYGSYPVERGQIQQMRGDIYAPSAYSNVYRHLRRAETPAKYQDCIEPDTPTNTIYVKSVGLNYEGVYKEYAIMDKRLAITVATAYLAVRKPISATDTSVAVLNAQDSCGRICKPICKVPGTEIFRPCSGAVKVTGSVPLQFGNSFGDAVLNVWDFNTDQNCPQLQTANIIVSFYCDYSTDWTWPSIAPAAKNTTGCDLGRGCVVNAPCDAIRTCTNGDVLECLGACQMYASCFNNSYMLYQCRNGERFLRGRGCVSTALNPCSPGG